MIQFYLRAQIKKFLFNYRYIISGGELVSKTEPFLRWVGGKNWFVDQYIDLIKNKLNTQSPTPFVENINQQIDSIINNINEIETDDNIKNINYKDDKHTDLIELINDIDSYKNYVQEEFDEVKYLIKFADRTHNLVNRHKNVMTKIFQKAGLRPAGANNEDIFGDDKKEEKVYKKPKKESKYWEGDDSDNNEDYEPQMRGGYYYRRVKKDENDLGEVFNKLKKINQVKENLCHIQDDCLGYHYNLKKTIQEKNKQNLFSNQIN